MCQDRLDIVFYCYNMQIWDPNNLNNYLSGAKKIN